MRRGWGFRVCGTGRCSSRGGTGCCSTTRCTWGRAPPACTTGPRAPSNAPRYGGLSGLCSHSGLLWGDCTGPWSAVGAFIVSASQPKERIFCRSKDVNCWALCFRTFSDVAESLPTFALFHLWKSDDRPLFPPGLSVFSVNADYKSIICCYKKPYVFIFKGHSLPCEPCSSYSQLRTI